jgi:hypothetical protein
VSPAYMSLAANLVGFLDKNPKYEHFSGSLHVWEPGVPIMVFVLVIVLFVVLSVIVIYISIPLSESYLIFKSSPEILGRSYGSHLCRSSRNISQIAHIALSYFIRATKLNTAIIVMIKNKKLKNAHTYLHGLTKMKIDCAFLVRCPAFICPV